MRDERACFPASVTETERREKQLKETKRDRSWGKKLVSLRRCWEILQVEAALSTVPQPGLITEAGSLYFTHASLWRHSSWLPQRVAHRDAFTFWRKYSFLKLNLRLKCQLEKIKLFRAQPGWTPPPPRDCYSFVWSLSFRWQQWVPPNLILNSSLAALYHGPWFSPEWSASSLNNSKTHWGSPDVLPGLKFHSPQLCRCSSPLKNVFIQCFQLILIFMPKIVKHLRVRKASDRQREPEWLGLTPTSETVVGQVQRCWPNKHDTVPDGIPAGCCPDGTTKRRRKNSSERLNASLRCDVERMRHCALKEQFIF